VNGEQVMMELCRMVREGRTGAVEWRQDKRRRLFFVHAGTLVLIQSNLRSESPERVKERMPGLESGQAFDFAVAQLRVTEAFREAAGEVLVHPDVEAPSFEPHDVVALLWGAAERLPVPPPGCYPRIVPRLGVLVARLPAGGDVVRYLLELDGSRPLEDVIDFGPEEPGVIARALSVALVLGALEVGTEADLVSVHGAARSPAPEVAADAPTEPPPDVVRARTVAVEPVAPPDEEEDHARFGGATVTVNFGGTRIVPVGGAAAAAPDPLRAAVAAPDPLRAAFGPLLRILQAPDHFAVLGTTWQDTTETHRRAYFTLAQALHPDRFTLQPMDMRDVASELFDRVRAAWEVLSDDEKREAYIGKVIRGERSEDEQAMDRVRSILDAEADFKRGVAELTAGRLPAAHELFQRVATAVPEEAEFCAYAGFTTFRLQHGRDAAAAAAGAAKVQAAVQANEKLDNVWVLHGTVLRTLGDEGGARYAFIAALKQRPSNPDAARELKRLDREAAATESASGGFFSRFFGKK
jgi:hypothetical protein